MRLPIYDSTTKTMKSIPDQDKMDKQAINEVKESGGQAWEGNPRPKGALYEGDSTTKLSNISKAKAEALAKMGIVTLLDLLSLNGSQDRIKQVLEIMPKNKGGKNV